MAKTIYLANDHGGLELRESVYQAAQECNYTVIDLGVSSSDSVDYPDYAQKVVEHLHADIKNHNEESFGILICGTGIGMSIAANRFPYIRAALCHTPLEGNVAKEHNNANVLCLGARVLSPDVAKEIIIHFLQSSFEGGRHQRRLEKINAFQSC